MGHRALVVKMKVSPTDASRDQMEKSWLDGLQVWKTINGNSEYERVSLETYYTAIRDDFGLQRVSSVTFHWSAGSCCRWQ